MKPQGHELLDRGIDLLREYRERLIADVVTGKVDVREVAARLPEEPPENEEVEVIRQRGHESRSGGRSRKRRERCRSVNPRSRPAIRESSAAYGGEIVLYQAPDGSVKLDVRLEKETFWLSLNQMAALFERDKSVISRHLRNIYKEGELERVATVAFFATVQDEGGRQVTRQVEYYNLDAILSVGYRVNSKRGTQFRIWATQVLRERILRGEMGAMGVRGLQGSQSSETKLAAAAVRAGELGGCRTGGYKLEACTHEVLTRLAPSRLRAPAVCK